MFLPRHTGKRAPLLLASEGPTQAKALRELGAKYKPQASRVGLV